MEAGCALAQAADRVGEGGGDLLGRGVGGVDLGQVHAFSVQVGGGLGVVGQFRGGGVRADLVAVVCAAPGYPDG